MIYTSLNFIETVKNTKRKNKFYERQRILSQEVNHKNVSNFLEGFTEEFERLKINYAQAEFSGGHDEGGYDSFVWLDKNKDNVD